MASESVAQRLMRFRARQLTRGVAEDLRLLAKLARAEAAAIERNDDRRFEAADELNALLHNLSVQAVRAWALRELIAAMEPGR
jgi:hypothetical protein